MPLPETALMSLVTAPLALAEIARVQTYLDAGVATSTRRAYATSWNTWLTWCAARGVTSLPASPELLAVWLTERAAAGAAPASLDRHLAAIVGAHHAAAFPSPRVHPAVRAVLRGIRRTHGTAPRQVAALRVEDLWSALPRGDAPRAIRDRALLLLGFAAALRRSELVALNVDDLEIRPEGLALTIRSSKTDPDARGEVLGVPRGRRMDLCPVTALAAWRAVLDGVAAPVTGALFRPINRHGTVAPSRLSDRAVAGVVKEAAHRAGFDPDRYAGHSLRAGFATSAAAAGLPERDIMRQTRHRSIAVFREYVRQGSIFLDNPVARLL